MRLRHYSPLILLVTQAVALDAQRVFVAHDEWMTNNTYFTSGSNERRLVNNALDWFGVGAGDRVLTWSGNQIGYINSPLPGVITGRGALYAQSTAAQSNLAQYKAIFVGGFAVDNTALINYVLGGGNVFLMGGTCTRLAAGASCDTNAGQEAADWQAFLQRFGMGFASQYNGLQGNLSTSAFASQGALGAALFTGVSTVYADNGNTVQTTIGTPAGVTRQVFAVPGGPALFGAAVATVVPEPSAVSLIVGGLGAIMVCIRRRRRPT
jgi:hypothetical protein